MRVLDEVKWDKTGVLVTGEHRFKMTSKLNQTAINFFLPTKLLLPGELYQRASTGMMCPMSTIIF